MWTPANSDKALEETTSGATIHKGNSSKLVWEDAFYKVFLNCYTKD